MQSHLHQPVARAVTEDRLRAARRRSHAAHRRARSPGRARTSAASAVARVARRLDPEAARRAMAA